MMNSALLKFSAMYLFLGSSVLVWDTAKAEQAPPRASPTANAALTDRLNNAEVGQKIYVQSQNGDILFAGQNIQMEGFSGLLGYAADVAYIVVAGGNVQFGDLVAKDGWMILIPPLGTPPSKVSVVI